MTNNENTVGEDLDLRREQERTLETPLMKINFILKMLIVTMDLFYGRKRTLPKFRLLEILARYPYWAWENGSYHRLSKMQTAYKMASPETTDQYLELIEIGRESQDNEQWHMLLIEEIIEKKGEKLGYFKHTLLPRMMVFAYYYLTRLMFFIRPQASFYMNAAFESHAEHEYMLMAKEHPEWDSEPVDSRYFEFYPRQKSLGDLIRRIGLDEREHMHHSIEEMKKWDGSKDCE